ncbi:DegT/DnrJ/EryC1/StrS family aminotransferase [Desulfovibrio cuneatus]|uniref:DegT/DnrJ/EryC1/StrS family aminotransferase n=1 Tax=Desulfovibrio cuneatus TaxID=159728 RepID=UPI000420E6A2|nr:DegT/DnrJ/EryC1/StrS family aminotransferase [Desulfovibrio cuneatus]
MPLANIPFANPHAAYAARKEAILEAITRALDSGYYILGSEVEQFEKDFAAYLGIAHTSACANGTDAIELMLRALGVGPGKAVFTVSHTAVATVSAIERAGAMPVLVDIDPVHYTMCPASLEQAVQHLVRTLPQVTPAAVLPVHIYGHPCNMDALAEIAARHNMRLLEDCAQAHGAQYKGKMVGTLGKAASFSFYPTKNLGALGDAGGVATSTATLHNEVCALRQYGWKERYISAIPGINSRMDPVQAAILGVQLTHLAEDTAARIRIAGVYTSGLAGTGLCLPQVAPWAKHAFHLYVVQCKERSAFMQYMQEHGIGTAIHYPVPVHLQPAYAGRVLCAPKGLPVTEQIMHTIVSLPMFPQLTDAQVERVCTTIQAWAKAGA